MVLVFGILLDIRIGFVWYEIDINRVMLSDLDILKILCDDVEKYYSQDLVFYHFLTFS